MADRYFLGTDITVGAGATLVTQVKSPQWAKKLIKAEWNAVAVGRLSIASQTQNKDIVTNVDFQKGTDNTYLLPDFPMPVNDIFNVTVKNTSGGSLVYNIVLCFEA